MDITILPLQPTLNQHTGVRADAMSFILNYFHHLKFGVGNIFQVSFTHQGHIYLIKKTKT